MCGGGWRAAPCGGLQLCKSQLVHHKVLGRRYLQRNPSVACPTCDACDARLEEACEAWACSTAPAPAPSGTQALALVGAICAGSVSTFESQACAQTLHLGERTRVGVNLAAAPRAPSQAPTPWAACSLHRSAILPARRCSLTRTNLLDLNSAKQRCV